MSFLQIDEVNNSRFTSARNSMIEGFNAMDIYSNEEYKSEGISFGTLQSQEINLNFGSAHNTTVGDTRRTDLEEGDMFKYPRVSPVNDVDKTPVRKRNRDRGISISSTLSANSNGSMKDVVGKMCEFPEGTEPHFQKEGSEWCDKPTWGVNSDTSSSPHEPRPQNESPKVSPLAQPANCTPESVPKDKMSSLAREGKLTYADILKCPSDPVPVPPAETPPQSNSLSVSRNRKNSSSSNASDKTRGYRKRGSRGSQRGRGKSRGKSFSSSPKYYSKK